MYNGQYTPSNRVEPFLIRFVNLKFYRKFEILS